MEFFGDESGHLNSLLDGNCDWFVLAVVGGDPLACGACPKRTVRNVSDAAEAKWNDLTEVQKRRMVDCLRDAAEDLRFCYVAIRKSDLVALDHHYLLFQDQLRHDWDLVVMAEAYASMLVEVAPEPNQGYPFTFDRIFGKAQSDVITEVLDERLPSFETRHAGSRQVRGLQAADCLAGAVAESLRDDADWLSTLGQSDVTCATEYALIGVEKRLHEVKTGP